MLSNAARAAGMITPNFEKERSQVNDENNNALFKNKSKSIIDSALVNKNRSSKGIQVMPGHTVTKRRALGDISNRKQSTNDTALSRKDGRTASKPLSTHSNSTKKDSVSRSTSAMQWMPEPQNSRKRHSALSNHSSAKPLPFKKGMSLNDEETVELPAGRLFGEGPASSFFDPVCSFDLEDNDDTYNDWNALADKFQKEREREIQTNDQRLEISLENLYQDDLCGFMSSFHVAGDINLLLEDDEPCLESSWGNHARCWMDDEISL